MQKLANQQQSSPSDYVGAGSTSGALGQSFVDEFEARLVREDFTDPNQDLVAAMHRLCQASITCSEIINYRFRVRRMW